MFYLIFFRFLIPKTPSGDGYCGQTIVKLYFDVLNEELRKNVTEGPVFYRGIGKPGSKFTKSKFTLEVMGKWKLSKIGEDIATFLNLSDPETYTGHCFR